MKALRIFVGICCLPALLTSCGGESIDTCGGKEPKPLNYSVTHYDATLVRYPQAIDEQSVLQVPTPLSVNQAVEWNAFSLEVVGKWQYYSSLDWPKLSLFEQALACSPAEHSLQKLTKISITSAHNYSDKYLAGAELAPLFAMLYARGSLAGLSGVDAPKELKLKLLEAPQYANQNFEIQISLSDGNVYILKTGDVYFTLP